MDWFQNTACVSGSLFEIPLDIFTSYDQVNMTVGFAISANNPMSYQTMDVPYVISVPVFMLASVFRVIEQNGARRRVHDSRSYKFSDCDRVSLLLPDLDIRFISGIIRLGPTDYIRHLGNDTCQLLVTYYRSTDRIHSFNPFLLNNVNVRFSNSSRLLCDSVSRDQ